MLNLCPSFFETLANRKLYNCNNFIKIDLPLSLVNKARSGISADAKKVSVPSVSRCLYNVQIKEKTKPYIGITFLE